MLSVSPQTETRYLGVCERSPKQYSHDALKINTEKKKKNETSVLNDVYTTYKTKQL